MYPKQLLHKIILSNENSNIMTVKENINNSPPKKKGKLSNAEKKLELFKQKKEVRERRHQEKLQLLRELFNKKRSN